MEEFKDKVIAAYKNPDADIELDKVIAEQAKLKKKGKAKIKELADKIINDYEKAFFQPRVIDVDVCEPLEYAETKDDKQQPNTVEPALSEVTEDVPKPKRRRQSKKNPNTFTVSLTRTNLIVEPHKCLCGCGQRLDTEGLVKKGHGSRVKGYFAKIHRYQKRAVESLNPQAFEYAKEKWPSLFEFSSSY